MGNDADNGFDVDSNDRALTGDADVSTRHVPPLSASSHSVPAWTGFINRKGYIFITSPKVAKVAIGRSGRKGDVDQIR